ncbi:MAG: TIGR02147 family protein [Moraxellaceae bacterium]|nr:TIGR02147 family protein [Pseudobdellovibrionaceae bacterium]
MHQAHELLSKILTRRLEELSEKRPGYSLRSLAKKLDISPSHLSRVLRGQKGISYQSALRLIKELDLTKHQSEEIIQLYKEQSNPKTSKVIAEQQKQQILNLEVFRMIADWYHFPILELLKTKKFKHSEDFIAKRLLLDKTTVTVALNRLIELGFIEKKQGQYRLTDAEMFETPDDIQNAAIKKHHLQMMDKAKDALQKQLPVVREFQSLNLNFDIASCKAAKKEIRKFVQSFNKKFSQVNGDEVYQLNLQLFSLTQEIL